MMTKEEFSRTNWKMSYEQYQKCYCPECSKKGCQHRNAYRRVPSIDGGLTLCPKLRSDKVYFNINTPSYMHDKDPSAFGFASDEARDEWYAAASKVIASFDILEDSGYNVENSAEKRAYLYPHPQQISGVILKNDVRKVAEAIECMSLSSIRWVDLYDTVYVLSDEAYEKYLMFKDEALKKDLFDVCQTPRITRFYDAIEISRALAMKYRLKRLGINDGRNYGSGQTIDHIMRLMQKMSEDGLLVMTSPSGEETYVRSLNKTELKKWIRSHMMLIEQYRFLWSNRKG